MPRRPSTALPRRETVISCNAQHDRPRCGRETIDSASSPSAERSCSSEQAQWKRTLDTLHSRYPSLTGGGYSEFVFGEWLRTRQVPRESIVISTKIAGDGGNGALECRYSVLGRDFSETQKLPDAARLTRQQIIDACDAFPPA